MTPATTTLDILRTLVWWWCPQCHLALMWFHPLGPLQDARRFPVMTMIVFVPCAKCSGYSYFRHMGFEAAWGAWHPART